MDQYVAEIDLIKLITELPSLTYAFSAAVLRLKASGLTSARWLWRLPRLSNISI